MTDVMVFCKKRREFYEWERYFGPRTVLTESLDVARETLRNQEVKVVLIDLEGQELEGLELASYLRMVHRYYLVPLIFLAQDRVYETRAFHEFHCYDYMIKPVLMDQIFEILNLLSGGLDPLYIPKGLVLRVKDGVHRVEMSEVVYVEILNHRLVVHTVSDDMFFPYRPLWECIDQSRGDLVQCHRAAAVNAFYVERLDYEQRIVILKDDLGSVPIGRKYMVMLRERIDERTKQTYTESYQKQA